MCFTLFIRSLFSWYDQVRLHLAYHSSGACDLTTYSCLLLYSLSGIRCPHNSCLTSLQLSFEESRSPPAGTCRERECGMFFDLLGPRCFPYVCAHGVCVRHMYGPLGQARRTVFVSHAWIPSCMPILSSAEASLIEQS
jgi:hypothetical protein